MSRRSGRSFRQGWRRGSDTGEGIRCGISEYNRCDQTIFRFRSRLEEAKCAFRKREEAKCIVSTGTLIM